MIHIYNCGAEVCALPGRCCKECGKLLDLCDCSPCVECCDQCGASLLRFFKKPLGTYVVLAVLFSGFELGCCVYSLTRESVLSSCVLHDDLGSQVGISKWLYAQLGMAWLNLIFAPYIQYQLWQRLQEEAREQNGPGEGPVAVTQQRVKESFKHVFLYDIGVCLYVFMLAGSFAWSYLGSQWLARDPACDADGYTSYAAWLGMLFFWFVVLYAITWYLYMECVSSLEVTPVPAHFYMPPQDMAHQGGGKPAGLAAAAAGGLGLLGGALGARPAGTAAVPGAVGASPGYAEPPAARVRGLQRACTPARLMKLVACLSLDLFGNASYLIAGLGEGADLAYAPAQAIALKMLFDSNCLAAFGFAEEIIPFTDIIPTATAAWWLETFAPEHPLTRMLGIRVWD